MSIIDLWRYRKKKDLKESDPVISREGKIGRKTGEIGTAEEQADRERRSVEVRSERNVTISDGDFAAESVVKKKKKKKSRVYTSKKDEKSPFPIMTVVFSMICTALIMSVIINFVQVNEYSKDISSLQKRVEEVHKESTELQTALDEKNNTEALRRYMSEHSDSLNMIDESLMKAPTAITPEKEDTISDYEAKETDEGLMSVVLNALAENFVNAWNIFSGEE